MRYYIYPYKPASQSAKNLARALGIKRIKHENSRFVPTQRKTVINWGATQLPFDAHVMDPDRVREIINKPEYVSRASNKLSFFERIEEHNHRVTLNEGYYLHRDLGIINIPEFTTDYLQAVTWLFEPNSALIERTVLNGSGGRGCRFVVDEAQVGDAPLYVQYIKKKEEFRVHVMNGEVIHVQRKARVRDRDDVNWQIRNHQNGFVYQINDIEVPNQVIDQAVKVMGVVGLDFGAVDVIWNDYYEKAYVLEANTAPGITGTTLEKYVDGFRRLYYV